jgi:hypothetical protein
MHGFFYLTTVTWIWIWSIITKTSGQPSSQPSSQPTIEPSSRPSSQPSLASSSKPSTPSGQPSIHLSANPSLHFILLGDWGKGGNSGYYSSHIPSGDEKNETDDDHVRRATKEVAVTYQANIAKAMSEYSETFKPSFVVALGDNFYGKGVTSTTDPYWDYLWTHVYLDDYPALRIPWFSVLGKFLDLMFL